MTTRPVLPSEAKALEAAAKRMQEGEPERLSLKMPAGWKRGIKARAAQRGMTAADYYVFLAKADGAVEVTEEAPGSAHG